MRDLLRATESYDSRASALWRPRIAATTTRIRIIEIVLEDELLRARATLDVSVTDPRGAREIRARRRSRGKTRFRNCCTERVRQVLIRWSIAYSCELRAAI